MKLRPACELDIPDLLRLLRQVLLVHHQIRPDIFRDNTQKYDAAQLSQILTDPDRPIFVAELDGAVVGYAFCIRKSVPEGGVMLPRTELYIDDLCVEETMRGRGIATALYRHVCQVARDMGCGSVTLNVWCGNENALRFYEKCGMKPRNITMEMPLEDKGC